MRLKGIIVSQMLAKITISAILAIFLLFKLTSANTATKSASAHF